MIEIDERTAAKLKVALEEVCRGLPHGGDHEIRKRIAQDLVQSAKEGNVTLKGLRTVANRSFSQLSAPNQLNRKCLASIFHGALRLLHALAGPLSRLHSR